MKSEINPPCAVFGSAENHHFRTACWHVNMSSTRTCDALGDTNRTAQREGLQPGRCSECALEIPTKKSRKIALDTHCLRQKIASNDPDAEAMLLERRCLNPKSLYLGQAIRANPPPTAKASAGAFPLETARVSPIAVAYEPLWGTHAY